MTRFAWFLAGLIVGAWCAGLAMRWEEVRPPTPPPDGWDTYREWERVDSV